MRFHSDGNSKTQSGHQCRQGRGAFRRSHHATITKPEHVWLEQTPGGANAALEIESENQTKTLLRFRSSMPPEMVDGVVLD